MGCHQVQLSLNAPTIQQLAAKKQEAELSEPLRPGSGVPGHHFYCTQLCQANHKPGRTRGEGKETPPYWEGQKVCTERGGMVGGHVGEPTTGVDQEGQEPRVTLLQTSSREGSGCGSPAGKQLVS